MQFDGITLITGAAGFLGRHLVRRLAESGVLLRVAVRPGEDARFLRDLGAQVLSADLLDPETLPPLFEGGVDRVFHLAAICNFSTPYTVLHPTNVAAVGRITRLAMQSGVKRYLQMSSSSVYGPHRGQPFLEDSEELALYLRGQIADLIEEEGASLGLPEVARLVADRAGERALHVSEELGASIGFALNRESSAVGLDDLVRYGET